MIKILVLSTGGTISHDVTEDGMHVSNAKATTGKTFAHILQTATRTFDEKVVIKAETILNKDSGNMVMSDWKAIIDGVVRNYDGYDGFIVTHGTETMGYSSAAVSFALPNLGKPVVFTGAQVAYGQIGTDAVINLENALRFIEQVRDARGVFVVFGSHIVAGTRAKKGSEFKYDAYKLQPRFPMIGMIGHRLEMFGANLERHASYLQPYALKSADLRVEDKFSDQVAIVSEFPGMRYDVIINMAKSGIKGFILRSYGSGVPNIAPPDGTWEDLRPAFEYLREKKIPIAITSQAPDARACMSIYEPSFLAKELGAIPTNDMGIEAAIAKMSWLLGKGYEYEKIRDLMQKPLRGEMVSLK